MTQNSMNRSPGDFVKPGRNLCYICSKDIILPLDISKPHYHICTSCGRPFCTSCGIQFLCKKCAEHLPEAEHKNLFLNYKKFQQAFGGGLAMTIIGPLCIVAGIVGIAANAEYRNYVWVAIGIAAIGIGIPLLIFGIRNLVSSQPTYIQFLKNEFTSFPIDAAALKGSNPSPAPGAPQNLVASTSQAEKPKFCSKCGKPVKPDAAFCEQCGAGL